MFIELPGLLKDEKMEKKRKSQAYRKMLDDQISEKKSLEIQRFYSQQFYPQQKYNFISYELSPALAKRKKNQELKGFFKKKKNFSKRQIQSQRIDYASQYTRIRNNLQSLQRRKKGHQKADSDDKFPQNKSERKKSPHQQLHLRTQKLKQLLKNQDNSIHQYGQKKQILEDFAEKDQNDDLNMREEKFQKTRMNQIIKELKKAKNRGKALKEKIKLFKFQMVNPVQEF